MLNPFQVFGIQVNLSHVHSDSRDVPQQNLIPPFSAAGSSRSCILPASWWVNNNNYYYDLYLLSHLCFVMYILGYDHITINIINFCVSCHRGGSNLVKNEIHLEVPTWQFYATKPQFELAFRILKSWNNNSEKPSAISKQLLHRVFSFGGTGSMLMYFSLA